jgi:hypothetical protein
MIAVTRGIQTPPRDCLKLFATFADALRENGIDNVGMHLALLRNYLAATVVAFKNPVTKPLSESADKAINDLMLDIEWFQFLTKEKISTTSFLAGAETGSGSFIGEGVSKLISPEGEAFYDEWMYNIRPATDDNPYFYNFFLWRSLPWMMETYGRHWFRRLELGYIILVIILLEVIVIGTVLILLPLYRFRKAVAVGLSGKLATAIYFLLLGLAFMLLEMTSILRFTRYLGEPVYATSMMIGVFLLSAGLGSISVGKLRLDLRQNIRLAIVAIILLGAIHILTTDFLMKGVMAQAYITKALIAIIATAPMGFFMGWLFPSGLGILSRNAEPLIPWAWAINGFASVAAPPIALMLSMSIGFRLTIIIAIVLYTLAGITAHWLPSKANPLRISGPTQ